MISIFKRFLTALYVAHRSGHNSSIFAKMWILFEANFPLLVGAAMSITLHFLFLCLRVQIQLFVLWIFVCVVFVSTFICTVPLNLDLENMRQYDQYFWKLCGGEEEG